MKFTIGLRTYRVEILPGPLDVNGPAAAHRLGTVLLIAGDLDPLDRLEAMFDQLWRAWCWELGTDRKPRCVAAFTTSILRQFQRQGGEGAFIKLQPERRAAA